MRCNLGRLSDENSRYQRCMKEARRQITRHVSPFGRHRQGSTVSFAVDCCALVGCDLKTLGQARGRPDPTCQCTRERHEVFHYKAILSALAYLSSQRYQVAWPGHKATCRRRVVHYQWAVLQITVLPDALRTVRRMRYLATCSSSLVGLVEGRV